MDESDPVDPIRTNQIRTKREREIVGRNRSRHGGAAMANNKKVIDASERAL